MERTEISSTMEMKEPASTIMERKEPPTQDDQTKKGLFKAAMKQKWDKVIEICKKDEGIHKYKITKSGKTVLHIAVSSGRDEVVDKLIEMIKEKNQLDALNIGDEGGNTPLHIAAAMGNVKMCECIAGADPKLIGTRNNNDGETPFFLAVLHGHKDAFLCLDFFCGSKDDGYRYSRRNSDGETILHCAISGDFFDLAFQIIHLYDKLVNSVNEQGASPLHLLATKPTAFPSGSHMGRYMKIIYHCIFVDKLQEDTSYGQSQLKTDEKKMKIDSPENYETCVNFVTLIHRTVNVLTDIRGTAAKKEQQKSSDAENPVESKAADRTGDHEEKSRDRQLFPTNYGTCFEFVKLLSKAMLIILGFGFTKIEKIHEKKQKHTWSVQILDELLQRTSTYESEEDGRNPASGQSLPSEEGETIPYAINDGGVVAFSSDFHQPVASPIAPKLPPDTYDGKIPEDKNGGKRENTTQILIAAKNGITKMVEKVSKLFPVTIHDMNSKKNNIVLLAVENSQPLAMSRETPILIAAKNGITEMVEKILELFPVAIHDMNSEKKNVVLLAVENRQPHVYQLLLKRKLLNEISVFRKVDQNGNSALHLAATFGEHKPWLIPGAALQMQWEIKWYEFVKKSMPFHFFVRYNKENKTPRDVFTETHDKLVQAGGVWLTNTSQSCSVVAALIATVAFATSATIPGGVNEESGKPTLERQPAFNVFAISSLVALCFSVTAMVLFLSILTSRYQERDFGKDLPRKLLLGLTSLFLSIASMLVSFCAGHFFVLRDELKFAALPVYTVTCLPVTFYAIAQFPLYFDLAWATFKKVPQRSYKSVPL